VNIPNTELVLRLFCVELDKQNLNKSIIPESCIEIYGVCWWNLFGYYTYKALIPVVNLTHRAFEGIQSVSQDNIVVDLGGFLITLIGQDILVQCLVDKCYLDNPKASEKTFQKALYWFLFIELFCRPDVLPISLYKTAACLFHPLLEASDNSISSLEELPRRLMDSDNISSAQFYSYYFNKVTLSSMLPTGYNTFCYDRYLDKACPSLYTYSDSLAYYLYSNPIYWNFFLKELAGSSCSTYMHVTTSDLSSLSWEVISACYATNGLNSFLEKIQDSSEHLLLYITLFIHDLSLQYNGSPGLYADASIHSYAEALVSSLPSSLEHNCLLDALNQHGFIRHLTLSRAIYNKLQAASNPIHERHSTLAAKASRSGNSASLDTIRVFHGCADYTGIGLDVACIVSSLGSVAQVSSHSVHSISPWLEGPPGLNSQSHSDASIVVSSPGEADIYSSIVKHLDTGPLLLYAPWELQSWPITSNIISRNYASVLAISTYVQESFSQLPVQVHLVSQTLDFKNIDLIAKTPANERVSSGINGIYQYVTALSLDSGFDRKNVQALINAFIAAFPSSRDVRLFIKATASTYTGKMNLEKLRAIASYDSRIVLDDKISSRLEHLELLATSDCFVSFHRSEGFGRNIAESMALGTPVVCTGYGGNMDFCDNTNSILVDYKLVGPGPSYSFSFNNYWADPDFSSCVEALKTVFHNPLLCDSLSSTAFTSIRSKLSPDLYTSRLLHAIGQYV